MKPNRDVGESLHAYYVVIKMFQRHLQYWNTCT